MVVVVVVIVEEVVVVAVVVVVVVVGEVLPGEPSEHGYRCEAEPTAPTVFSRG